MKISSIDSHIILGEFKSIPDLSSGYIAKLTRGSGAR
jgi:hypothetical protein